MAIDFRCTECNKLLRTPDDTAGKRAKCPDCGAVMTIPEAPANAGGSAPPPPSGGSPFGSAGPQPSFSADSGNPYQSPSPFASTGPIGFQGPISQGTLDLGDILSRTWILFKIDWGMCVGATLIVLLLNAGISSVSVLVPIIGPIVSSLFSLWLNIGLALFFLKKARGQNPEFGELFNGWPYFVKILLGSILVGLIVIGIFSVCVAPLFLVGLTVSFVAAVLLAILGGIVAVPLIWYVTLMFSQFYYLILDRNLDVIDALKTSQRLMDGNKLMLFLINLVAGVLGSLVMLFTCFLGVFVVVPFIAMMHAVIYLTVTNQPTAEQVSAVEGSPFGSLPRMGPVQ